MPTAARFLSASTKNSKDVWADADYWFGPDGGVTVMMYRGSKDQIQNSGAPDQFTYRPTFYRVGAFGNYLFFDKLDLLGGYIHSHDDWEWTQGAKLTITPQTPTAPRQITTSRQARSSWRASIAGPPASRLSPRCIRAPGASEPNTLLRQLGNIVGAHQLQPGT